MNKIRFGIIGVGNQGTYYSNGLLKEGKIENGVLTAICDIKKERVDALVEKLGDYKVKTYNDYIEMIESGEVDAVIITTPHYEHPEIVINCLNRGMNVICDKPAGVYTKQVLEMNEVAKKSNAKFAMMFNQRTNCVYRKMREMISGGEIGEIQRVTWIITDWFRTQFYYDSGNWRATWEGEGGGVLINQCPHQIDLVSWVVGKMPKTVRGFCKYGHWHDIEVEDEVTAYFEYDNGATGVFITTTGETPGTNRFEVSGTKGKLVCENNKLFFHKLDNDSKTYYKALEKMFVDPVKEVIEVETDGNNYQHAGIINNFANALLGLEEIFTPGIEGINGVELMNAIELSGWNDGERISIPVDAKRYLKELNKKRKTSRLKTVKEVGPADTTGTF